MANWKTPRPLASDLEKDRRKRPNQLYAAHVTDLNKFVEKIREIKHDDSVPWFDPAGAGVKAKVLLLLQDPSNTAKDGTGFISPDNPDPTADNTTFFRDNAKLLPQELVHWNIVPWKIGDKDFDEEIRKAKTFLIELIDLLPKLMVVVCMGESAVKGWNLCYPKNLCRPGWVVTPSDFENQQIIALACPHPSPQSLGGRHANELMDGLTPSGRIERTLSNVRKILDYGRYGSEDQGETI